MIARLALRDWGRGEWWAGARGALGWVRRSALTRVLSAELSRAWQRPVHLLDSGRSALAIALMLLRRERPDADEVILPALACPALRQTVERLGMRPVYADIAADLNTSLTALRVAASPATLAVVLVHAYGLPADAAAVAAWCREAGIGLIDDAAQIVAPETGLGGFGDFGLFSFAQSKCVVSGIDGSGGALLVNATRHAEAAAALCAGLSAPSGRLGAWAEFACAPWSARLSYYVARLRAPRTPGLHQIGSLDAAIVSAQLRSLPQRRAQRRQVLERWADVLSATGYVAPQLQAALAQTGWLARLMLRVPAGTRADCREKMAQAGVQTRLPYALPESLPAGVAPMAADAAENLLEFPLDKGLLRLDRRRLQALLQ